MAWITPRLWAPGLVTSTMMNEISSNFFTMSSWTSFTPTLYRADTNAVIGSSSASGRYLLYDEVCIARGEATFTAASVGGAAISLPVVPSTRQLGVGVCALWGPSTPADQTGQAYMTSDRTKLVVVAYTSGFRAAASGDVLRYQVIYKTN